MLFLNYFTNGGSSSLDGVIAWLTLHSFTNAWVYPEGLGNEVKYSGGYLVCKPKEKTLTEWLLEYSKPVLNLSW